MKAYKFVAIGICALLLLPACGKMEPVPTESEARTEDAAGRESVSGPDSESREESAEISEPESVSEAENDISEQGGISKTSEEEGIALFDEMPEHFVFSSGAGAWSTDLELADDGSFSGVYHDSEMGLTGEGYPGGTVYICRFSGRFSEPERTEGDIWSVKIDALQTEGTEGEEYYEDGVRYVYARPYGLTGTDELQIFTAGMPVDQIPEGFLSWTGMYFDPETEDCLPFYGIYNAAEDCAFISME